jgi:hypothetical protein
MKHWKMDERGSTVTSWLVDGEMPWGSAQFDPLVRKAHLMYRAYDSWQGAKDYVWSMINNDTWGAFGNMIEILDYGACDPNAVSRTGSELCAARKRSRTRCAARVAQRRGTARSARRCCDGATT